jgi:hypothetical protein
MSTQEIVFLKDASNKRKSRGGWVSIIVQKLSLMLQIAKKVKIYVRLKNLAY